MDDLAISIEVLGTRIDQAALLELRRACHMRTTSVCEAPATLTAAGRVAKSDAGYRLRA